MSARYPSGLWSKEEMPSMYPHDKDPGRFNPALRNREAVLNPASVEASLKGSAPAGDGALFPGAVVDRLRDHTRALGTALREDNLAAAAEAVVALAALASRTGARQLERDGRLIEASLRAGRAQRAQRLWHRLHGDLAALEEALGQRFPGSGRTGETAGETHAGAS